MAGILKFGHELDDGLAGVEEFQALFPIESVKIVPDTAQQTAERLYGEVTQSAIASVEALEPRDRVFCMAVTADLSPKGEPTAWSAAVDQSCFGSEAEDAPKRLMVISAGNANWDDPTYQYPDSNINERVQDPAQAWNALVVGAYTALEQHDVDDYPEWSPVAAAGKLSPTSTTSALWDSNWPNRPDLVLEGGNLLTDGTSRERPDCMSLLTSRRRLFPGDRLLASFGETSCATALAARLCALIRDEHYEIWPESVRGLLVHSARWTPEMMDEVRPLKGKQRYRVLTRTVGMGVPNLPRAIRSARDSVTMVTEGTLRPFTADGKVNELHLYDLPWPKVALTDLGATPVRLRLTLSYFIDPRPGRREVWTTSSYASHGLRFQVKAGTETKEQFLARINEEARDSSLVASKGDTKRWLIGPTTRDRGSIHSDVWQGSAQELVDKESLAIFPVKGWWADDPLKVENEARYSLIVSIETAEIDVSVDLYTEIAAQVEVETEVALDALDWETEEL